MSKKIFLFILSGIFYAAGPAYAYENELYVDGQILVKYKKGLSERSRDMIAWQVNAERVEEFKDFDTELIELPVDMSVEKGVKKYKFYPKVEIAEPNYYIQSCATTPNDTNFLKLWSLNNTGQSVNGTSGTSDADIDGPEAWDTTTGSATVVVALLDSGMDLDHEDLVGNLWTNSGETAGNSVDDDGNGYVDDVNGWDFVNSDNSPADDNDHGSNMSGIIGATGNNNKGVCGVNWTLKIMPLKVLGADGTGSAADAASAINYAAAKNVKVINASWSLTGDSATVKTAIENSGALFVTPAGNGGDDDIGDDIESSPVYPASYDSSNILSVASTDQDDAISSFSNYGAASVDVAAPGENIYTSEQTGTYEYVDGTSASTAFVSGVAGLILAVDSTLTVAQLKDQITDSVDTKSGLSSKVTSGGRINANSAVTAPSAPSGLSTSAASSSQINLSWTDNSTNEAGFKIERKTGTGSYSQIDTAAQNAASYSDTGLSASTAYTYKIRAYNNIGNSAYSDEASATTSSGGGGGGSGGGGGGGCFIATAVFGSPAASEVKVLCDYRDRYLASTLLGRSLVSLYYRVSPCIARRIEKNQCLKFMFRFIIRVIAGILEFLT